MADIKTIFSAIDHLTDHFENSVIEICSIEAAGFFEIDRLPLDAAMDETDLPRTHHRRIADVSGGEVIGIIFPRNFSNCFAVGIAFAVRLEVGGSSVFYSDDLGTGCFNAHHICQLINGRIYIIDSFVFEDLETIGGVVGSPIAIIQILTRVIISDASEQYTIHSV